MKKFWKEVSVQQSDAGWQVTLDGRGIKTQRGGQQVVPTEACAQMLAKEWAAQGDEVDPKSFIFRDMADFAIDIVRPDRDGTITKLLSYADTDTLTYRANPDEPLYERQEQMWEPLVTAFEKRHDVSVQRVSGIMHAQQPEKTMQSVRKRLEQEDDFTLAALMTLASLAASIVVPLAVIDDEADSEAMFAAANAEEDWQAELWGWDAQAEAARKARLEAFACAARFAKAVRG
ncbi:ATP12 family chaperone protein [Aurantiacibacter sp. MUD61]|uniref:ATP12 family chaperone protein n=1 Tax=Aurantiacibacter sp. MUD61 TaxID=3009083 RepID=UPI0022F01FC5|nr:ATP12 family protein [Aurantiacibacter sp. MUD61]